MDLILDVGANAGQYALKIRSEGFRGKIVSFEPLPDAHATLLEKAKGDPLWIVHKRAAVGSRPGEAEINISQNSESSSILPMLNAHSTADPASSYIGKARTEVITLDSVFDSYRRSDEKTFLKIDTQGFEDRVLGGISANLKNVSGVQLELSIVPLYDGQRLYPYFFDFFEKSDFFLWSLTPGFFDSSTGQLLQFDAVFVR